MTIYYLKINGELAGQIARELSPLEIKLFVARQELPLSFEGTHTRQYWKGLTEVKEVYYLFRK